jgi:hypothetical protein
MPSRRSRCRPASVRAFVPGLFQRQELGLRPGPVRCQQGQQGLTGADQIARRARRHMLDKTARAHLHDGGIPFVEADRSRKVQR